MISKLRLTLAMLVCGAAIQIVRQYATTSRLRTTSNNDDDSAQTAVTKTLRTRPNRGPGKHSDNAIVIDARGNLSERLKRFNDVIDRVRADVLMTHNLSGVDDLLAGNYNHLLINSDKYVEKLDASSHISTLVLPWRHATSAAAQLTANLHVQTYYPFSGSHLLCNWLGKRRKRPQLYIRVFRRMRCNDNVAVAMRPTPINYGHLKANTGVRQKPSFYSRPPSSLVHLHVIRGLSYIDSAGHITSRKVRLVLDYCYRFRDVHRLTRRRVTAAPYYDELFAMKHPPGGAFYHGVVEEIPRIAAFVEFLRRHRQVRVHATRTRRVAEFLRVLGLEPSRAVSGPVTAGLVYVPRAASCMMPRVLETQLLSQHCVNYVERNLTAGRPRRRDRLVLILRSGKRRFAREASVVRVVRAAAADFRLRFTEFRDDPPPSFRRTMITFYEAAMVVAGHGAGLSNILFCRPGVFVVEVVPNSFITPLCYLQLAHGLGHHWHGIPVLRFGADVIRVNVHELRYVIRDYLQLRAAGNNRSVHNTTGHGQYWHGG